MSPKVLVFAVFAALILATPASAAIDLRNSTLTVHVDRRAIHDLAGFSVADAGDINGDGVDDVVTGAPAAPRNGLAAGSIYVVYGGQDFAKSIWPFRSPSAAGSAARR
jgi:hypothetical protein